MKIIKHYLFITIFFSTAGVVLAQSSQFKIESLKAYLFYNSNKDLPNRQVGGTISENIFDISDLGLWNTIIGEGGAEGASNQTLVVVEIRGIGDGYKTGIIRLSCKSPEKVVFTQENEFSIFSTDNKHSHAFLINDTGCDHLEITAEVLDDKKIQIQDKMKKNILFECGE